MIVDRREMRTSWRSCSRMLQKLPGRSAGDVHRTCRSAKTGDSEVLSVRLVAWKDNSWLTEWRHLESLHPKGQGGSNSGWSASLVKAELGQTQRCPVIIVGGTNGKGSTCAYLESIYRTPAIASAATPRRTCLPTTSASASNASRLTMTRCARFCPGRGGPAGGRQRRADLFRVRHAGRLGSLCRHSG
jgi:hypothetical protein